MGMKITKRCAATRMVLIPLSAVVIAASAQTPAELPLPDATTLVQQAVLQERIAESKEQEYVFREDTNDIRLRKECTWAPKCPAPFGFPGMKGVAFQVVHYSEHHFEVFWLDGVRVARVLPPCDDCGRGTGSVDSYIRDIPVTEAEFAVENQRIDSEVAEATALRRQGRNPNSPDDPPQILLSRMLELCVFSNPRRQIIDSRSTILLETSCNPSENSASASESLIKSFSGTVGIDEEEHAVQQVAGRFLSDVKLGGDAISIRKGTRVTITNRRVDAGIWLLSRLDARGEGHYFSFSFDGDGHIFCGNYRKFHGTSTILPGYQVVSGGSPTPSNTKPSTAPVAPH